MLQTIERELKCLESLLYYVALLSLRILQSQIALGRCCIPKQTHFFSAEKQFMAFSIAPEVLQKMALARTMFFHAIKEDMF